MPTNYQCPLLAQLGSEHWFLADALGSTLGLTSPTGTLTDTFKYEAFGTSLGRTGTTVTPYQYVGGYGYFNEPSVGLEQVWWRWLDMRVGRFISRDAGPAMPSLRKRLAQRTGPQSTIMGMLIPSINRTDAYRYVGSNPVVYMDPSGLFAWHKHPWPFMNPNDGFNYDGYNRCMDECVSRYEIHCSSIIKGFVGTVTGIGAQAGAAAAGASEGLTVLIGAVVGIIVGAVDEFCMQM